MPKLITSPRKSLRHLLIAASALTLMACATATPYQPASEPGGYDGFSQQMIENNRARITFGGNSLTKRETVENYLLYRSAEMAVERGFETFTLQERDLEKDQKVVVTPGSGLAYDPYFGYSFFRPGFGWSRGYRYSRFRGFNRGRGFGRLGFYDPFYDPFFDDVDVRENQDDRGARRSSRSRCEDHGLETNQDRFAQTNLYTESRHGVEANQ